MIKQRVITAIILIAFILAILFFASPAVFCVFMGLIAIGATWEWTSLMGMSQLPARLFYLVLMASLFFAALFIPIAYLLLLAVIWWLVALVLIVLYPHASACWGRGVYWRGVMGVMVLLPCWAAINYIRNQRDGLEALIFLFILIWGADTAAYFVGKRWGKSKLAAVVSPGKSIQGLCGALAFTLLITMLILWQGHVPLHGWPWVFVLSITTVLFSIVGDLFESMLKRYVGIKDSGQLLPGHGGLLDRIDSLTAAAPIFAFGALLLGMYL